MQKKPHEDQAPALRKEISSGVSARPPDALRPLSDGWGPKIAELEMRAKAALTLLDRVRSLLPENEKMHLLSATYHEETLVLTVDSAAWTAQLRYQEETLREQLQNQGEKPFTLLKVRVGRP